MKTFVKVIYEEAVNVLSLHIHRFLAFPGPLTCMGTCSQGFAPPSDRQGRRTTPSAAESAVFRPPFHALRSAVPCEVTQGVLAADRQLPRQQGQERLPEVETSRQAPARLLLPVKTPNEAPTLQSRA